jgi:hypothetical protein
MERSLLLEFVRATEAGALASARFMGRGDSHGADNAAVEAMRRSMDEVNMDGTIVIGEGERDEAPMLYIGEKVGGANHNGTNAPAAGVAPEGARKGGAKANGPRGRGQSGHPRLGLSLGLGPERQQRRRRHRGGHRRRPS